MGGSEKKTRTQRPGFLLKSFSFISPVLFY